ncbi:hypothetical protein CHRYSEOSP005_02770 [Chryseobacterium sp. Alg-005]
MAEKQHFTCVFTLIKFGILIKMDKKSTLFTQIRFTLIRKNINF